MITLLWLIIGVLATWRAASLLGRERGPFAVGTKLRSLVGVHHDDNDGVMWDTSGEVLLDPVTRWAAVDDVLHEVARGMTCILCCSVWMGALVAVLLAGVAPTLVFDAASWVLLTLALSAGAIGFDKLAARA